MRVVWGKVGQWDTVTRLTQELSSDLHFVQKDILESWGHRAEQVIKSHIERQDLGWDPLAATTIKLKTDKARPYIEEAWRETNYLYSNINFWLNDRIKADTINVGFTDTDMHPSGEMLGEIAKKLEYGSGGLRIPPRPLFGPSLDEMEGLTQDMLYEGLQLLSIRLKRKYGVTNITMH